jgi:hypothetical protein
MVLGPGLHRNQVATSPAKSPFFLKSDKLMVISISNQATENDYENVCF